MSNIRTNNIFISILKSIKLFFLNKIQELETPCPSITRTFYLSLSLLICTPFSPFLCLFLCSSHSLPSRSVSLSLCATLSITIFSCCYHVRFLSYQLNIFTFIYFFPPSFSIFFGTRADINCTQT